MKIYLGFLKKEYSNTIREFRLIEISFKNVKYRGIEINFTILNFCISFYNVKTVKRIRKCKAKKCKNLRFMSEDYCLYHLDV
jgi:hypothetical protein